MKMFAKHAQVLLSNELCVIFLLFTVVFIGHAKTAYGATAFVVEKGGSGSKVLITDGYSQFIIEHDYNCYDSDFYEGTTFYIDTNYSPSYGNKIIISGYSKKVCEVTSSDEVNIKQYYVDNVFDSEDKIIVTDKTGDQFLVEYGIGCGVSMWRYEGKKVDIDIGGSFLDGIGDRMYLFDSGRDCKVWDADELGGGERMVSGVSLAPAPVNYAPPAILNTKESCIRDHGLNSILSGSACTCKDNYMFNAGQQCMPAGDVCSSEYGEGGIPSTYSECRCAYGYHLENGRHCVADAKPVMTISANVKKWVDDNYWKGNTPCSSNAEFTPEELKVCDLYNISSYRQKYEWQVEQPASPPLTTLPVVTTPQQKIIIPASVPPPPTKPKIVEQKSVTPQGVIATTSVQVETVTPTTPATPAIEEQLATPPARQPKPKSLWFRVVNWLKFW